MKIFSFLFLSKKEAQSIFCDENLLVKKFETGNDELVKIFFNIAKDQRKEELERAKAIDTKATSLISLLGIVISAFSVSLSVKNDQPYFKLILKPLGIGLCILTALTVVFSLYWLFRTILAAEAKTNYNESDVLEGITKHDAVSEDAAVRLAMYYRYLSEHVWKLYRNAYQRAEEKAKCLKKAQIGTLVALLLFIAFQVYAVVEIRHMGNDNSSSGGNQSSNQGAQGAQSVTVTPTAAPGGIPVVQQSSPGTTVTNSYKPTPSTARLVPEVSRSGTGTPVTESKNPSGGRKK